MKRPEERIDQIGRGPLEAALRRTMADGALSHGWILAGGVGAGKATLAFRMARAALDPKALVAEDGLQVDAASRVFRLVAQKAHPDLFIAERLWNEKTSKYQTEITIETIRKLTSFLNKTPALGAVRVAIIDTADDLNRNAANALLKILEEPPAHALLMLLSASPGRLMATIRSRCRRIDLRAVAREEIIALLKSETEIDAQTAERIADHADGRPGYALQLATEEGASALSLADAFLKASRKGGDIDKIAGAFTARTPAETWGFFKSAVLTQISDAARVAGRGETIKGPLAGADPASLTAGWERAAALADRGDALNLDRASIVTAMGHDLRQILTAP